MNDDNDTYFSLDEAWDQGLRQKTEAMLEEKSGRLRALGILSKVDQAAEERGITFDQTSKVKALEFMRDNGLADNPGEALDQLYPNQSTQPSSQSNEPLTRQNLGDRIGESLGGQRVEPQPTQPNGGEETFVDAMRRRMGQ